MQPLKRRNTVTPTARAATITSSSIAGSSICIAGSSRAQPARVSWWRAPVRTLMPAVATLLLTLLHLLPTLGLAAQLGAQERPNILFCIADDGHMRAPMATR
mgnify:CR=1 FL=1